MNINSAATHAATEQRNSVFKSRALKWSSQAGSLGFLFDIFSCFVVCNGSDGSDMVEHTQCRLARGKGESMGAQLGRTPISSCRFWILLDRRIDIFG